MHHDTYGLGMPFALSILNVVTCCPFAVQSQVLAIAASPRQAAKAEETPPPAPGLTAKQKKKEALKRADEKSEAAGFMEPFQAPEKAPAAKPAAPKPAAPQSARPQAESSGR